MQTYFLKTHLEIAKCDLNYCLELANKGQIDWKRLSAIRYEITEAMFEIRQNKLLTHNPEKGANHD